eukprot:4711476-Prymnesium_polylepis.2
MAWTDGALRGSASRRSQDPFNNVTNPQILPTLSAPTLCRPCRPLNQHALVVSSVSRPDQSQSSDIQHTIRN